MKYRVGLTGGIGSGKSTVAAIFADQGAAVIDSDAISHRLTQSAGAAIAPIRAEFGDNYIAADGALNRSRMRQLVFFDADARHRLENILHPLILDNMLETAGIEQGAPYQLLVIPLLFETPSYQKLVQHTLVVDCEATTQVTRARLRSGLDDRAVHAIMAAQVSRVERLKRADDVIKNDGDLASLRQQVEQLHQRYLAISTGKD